MQVEIITLNTANWEAIIRFAKENLNVEPTRGLDNLNIPLKDPVALPVSLGFDNKQDKHFDNLKFDGWKHCYYTFLIKTDPDVIADLLKAKTTTTVLKETRSSCILILSGSIYNIVRDITDYCYEDYRLPTRLLFNKLYEYLIQTNLKRLLNFQIKEIPDGSFVIV